MTKNNRFKTYAQLEKMCRRILSRPTAPNRKARAGFAAVLRTLAGDTFPKNIRSDSPALPRWYPVSG